MITTSVILIKNSLNIFLVTTLIGVSSVSCAKPIKDNLSTDKFTSSPEIPLSSVSLNLTIEDAIEHSILHSAMKDHPAGKKILTQKEKFRKLAMSCLKENRTTLGLGGQFYGPYELPENTYIFALNCADYITGPELRLFLMNAEGVLSTTPLEIEMVDVHKGGDYEIKSGIQVFGLPEYDVNKQTLSFRNYCKATAGRQSFLSVYQINNQALKLKELWLDKQEPCSGKQNLQQAF
jgi:hypothetical protein